MPWRFRNNRKVFSDKDGKSYRKAIDNLTNQLEELNSRTLGEFLWQRYCQVQSEEDQTKIDEQVRVYGMKMGHHQDRSIRFNYKDNSNPIFPTRDMVEHEFELLWEAQRQYNPIYSVEKEIAIRDIIFHQRELQIPAKGKCELEYEEERAPKAHPLFQECRFLQSLNNMKVVDVYSNETRPLPTMNTILLCSSEYEERSGVYRYAEKTMGHAGR